MNIRITKTRSFALLLLLALAGFSPAHASTVLGPWVPIFKGVDHAVGTNTPGGGGFPRQQVTHLVRVNLKDPDIQLFTTPRIAGYSQESRETGGLTVSAFLATNKLQVVINANFFDPGDYYLPANTPMDVHGLAISKGVVVSPQEGPAESSSILFDSANVGTVIHTNWPATNNAKFYTAVTGIYPLVINGANIGARYQSEPDPNGIHQPNPRTALGLSRDGQYLYLMTLDGRQSGYSDGSIDAETGAWMVLAGAWNAINMDGGGSTTLSIADSLGAAIRLNHPSAVADSGRERTVGSHFGVYAKPLPGFINDITVVPDDESATITWTTISPATTQVQYGLSVNNLVSTPLQSAPVTNHSVLLSGLLPNTGYFFHVTSADAGGSHVSSNLTFTTTSHAVTNSVFEITNSWKYATENLDGKQWTSPAFNDSAWTEGPGLLWVDLRAAGPNPDVQPKGTQMRFDPATGFPYITYYFRKHFTNSAAAGPGSALSFTAYIDDGAVFYLNGHEIYRAHMGAGAIGNTSLAPDYECAGGDATCPIEFEIRGDLLTTNLVSGDNVLAAEVHNYNARSPDITFGLSMAETSQIAPRATLRVSHVDGQVTLSWDRTGFTLQQSPTPLGPWDNVPGPVLTSPFTLQASAQALYFRLRK